MIEITEHEEWLETVVVMRTVQAMLNPVRVKDKMRRRYEKHSVDDAWSLQSVF